MTSLQSPPALSQTPRCLSHLSILNPSGALSSPHSSKESVPTLGCSLGVGVPPRALQGTTPGLGVTKAPRFQMLQALEVSKD